jgi:UDP-N-acetylglucosamine acyltransferase
MAVAEASQVRAARVHPTAVVDKRVQLGEGVEIGPYVVIEGPVVIGPETRVLAHSVLEGPLEVGAKCMIGPAAYVGLPAQHLKGATEDTWLIIGSETVIREAASINRSMYSGKEKATRIGNACFIMGQTHVAHDCQVGDKVVIANGTALAGHVQVGQSAFLGGGTVVHQFVRIGRLALTRGNEPVGKDVPPFGALGLGGLKGYNAVGCRRSGMPQASLWAIRQAYQTIHTHRKMSEYLPRLREIAGACAEVGEMVAFIEGTKRGIPISTKFLRGARGEEED